MKIKIPYWLAKKNELQGKSVKGGVIIEGEVIAETEKAYRLKINGAEHWMPKSQITEPTDDEKEIEIPAPKPNSVQIKDPTGLVQAPLVNTIAIEGVFDNAFIQKLSAFFGKKVRITVERL